MYRNKQSYLKNSLPEFTTGHDQQKMMKKKKKNRESKEQKFSFYEKLKFIIIPASSNTG